MDLIHSWYATIYVGLNIYPTTTHVLDLGQGLGTITFISIFLRFSFCKHIVKTLLWIGIFKYKDLFFSTANVTSLDPKHTYQTFGTLHVSLIFVMALAGGIRELCTLTLVIFIFSICYIQFFFYLFACIVPEGK